VGGGPRRNASRPPAWSAVILVDSSVWIAHLRGHRTPATAKLEAAASREPLLIGDLILLEILQGARDESHAARIERGLRRYALVPLLDADLAPRAARNYRKLRDLGITIRKTADIIIGTFCIERRHALLHDDRDFVPMEEHLGLVVA
jgi:predicted nucleic acid-binding protein